MKECRKHSYQKNKMRHQPSPKTETVEFNPQNPEREADKLSLLMFATEYRMLANAIGVNSTAKIRCGRVFVKLNALEQIRQSFGVEFLAKYEEMGVRVGEIS